MYSLFTLNLPDSHDESDPSSSPNYTYIHTYICTPSYSLIPFSLLYSVSQLYTPYFILLSFPSPCSNTHIFYMCIYVYHPHLLSTGESSTVIPMFLEVKSCKVSSFLLILESCQLYIHVFFIILFVFLCLFYLYDVLNKPRFKSGSVFILSVLESGLLMISKTC